jgi:hypothetical protein
VVQLPAQRAQKQGSYLFDWMPDNGSAISGMTEEKAVIPGRRGRTRNPVLQSPAQQAPKNFF